MQATQGWSTFKIFPTLLVFLVAYAVSRLNIWPSSAFPLKLVPRHALTGVLPDAKTVLQAGFCDYVSKSRHH